MSLPSDLAIIALIGDRLRTAQITVHDLGSKGLCLIYYSPSGWLIKFHRNNCSRFIKKIINILLCNATMN